ncbi:hypothetical protein GUITHDRAFT_82405 [Guillardia theta CCMP2712]|uniref:ABC transporter domain-containing protein n=1 Tax=Guillardia theta (strain CCMP2712) TaxID=905079 RepID=L1I8W6_GUITC|nr:hypothetical protein GUITHDRAFT_82405 [Guillardia theta CCMP2712]EKX32324.1 hypothetical protein GUITHDRAFT_82405 [Guillardia theta CCMP2712]|eukprot:XP_005819304.1 hypothetical protein GUITHDRAFT_82405 [Guillardia theta CCMP2712]
MDANQSYPVTIYRQTCALLLKNFILAKRNYTSTFLRIFASFFFVLLIFLCNEGLLARFGSETYVKDIPHPTRQTVSKIPSCVPKASEKGCVTFGYSPAPKDNYFPDKDYSSLQDFISGVSWRYMRVITSFLTSRLQRWDVHCDTLIKNGIDYSTSNGTNIVPLVQENGTAADQIRGTWTRPFLNFAVPMQVQAQKEIARQVFLKDPNFKIDVAIEEFAHPAFQVSSFVGQIAPLFLLGCAMFPFVIQMNEIVLEKEQKLRQVLSSMGLTEVAYWLSWHIYQSSMAFIYSLLLTLFGLMFQFDIFKKNDFGVLFLTFWLFEQSMIGLAFMLGAFLRRAEQAVTVGFALFLIAFIFFFVITFGFPYGAAAEPLFSLLPPNLLSKNIADLGALTATDKNNGIRFSEAYSYCTINPDLCNPPYSVGNSWSWYIGMYFVYSLIGLYLENVLPDAMGVKKAPWYLFTPAYWGLSTAHITDDPDAVIEASKDEDVLSEESTAKTRANQDMDGANAIEIRGLTQTFKRGGKPFHAVKAPWYVVKKNQLFALLGPNGAGKTTTINMLTGFLPPTAGNALVFGNTVAHPSGMNRVKRVIGVCPQFDILWERLTAREHLAIFAIIKGIKPDSVYHEADKRIEEVRLNDAANQIAGSFSGGMKRRLSVAVSLIGNPSVVYLDEPTTGMDPINRRHVWDVIEAAKQDRCVVLTTHSMEEADILGDRIGIMAKGRLRCIGSSVRLKSRFGGGYRISVSCGDKMTPNSPQSLRVKEMFRESLRVEVSEESKTYLHFNVPTADSSALQSFFELLEGKKQELSIVDVQLSMSTLEDVFLNIAKQSEKEEAMLLNKTVNVTLRNGEVVGVLLGNEEELVSPNGVKFTVKWGADENGNLIVVDTKESNVTQKSIVVTVPEGVGAGELVQVEVEGQTFNVTVPENAPPGTTFNATAYVEPKNTNASLFSDSTMIKISEEEVQERVTKLHTSFGQQAGASFSKNLSLQSRKWLTNCCLVLIPIFFIIIILMLQFLLEILFLGQPTVRCPYCGPANDTFAKSYCGCLG